MACVPRRAMASWQALVSSIVGSTVNGYYELAWKILGFPLLFYRYRGRFFPSNRLKYDRHCEMCSLAIDIATSFHSGRAFGAHRRNVR